MAFTWLHNTHVRFLGYFAAFFVHAVCTASKGMITAMPCFVGGDVTSCSVIMSSALMMEATGSSVSSVHIYQTTRRYIKMQLFYVI